ncbi:transcriptional regulator, partial [Streptomyces solisilvae]
MAVLVGGPSTGKTRACAEAIRSLDKQSWSLWHPFDPTRAEAALGDLERVGPRTVVWLDELQHYLAAGAGLGERIAAALYTLLTSPERGPVLILGTMGYNHAADLTALPNADSKANDDIHAQARMLLSRRIITVADSFDAVALVDAKQLADEGDRQLALALEQARDGRVTQFLAGAPDLLRRYQTASPPARAVLEVAMDAYRLGIGLHLPVSFLGDAATDYLAEDEYDALGENWLEKALAETSRPVHGQLAPLRRVRLRPSQSPGKIETPPFGEPVCRLATYLEQYGHYQRRRLCPPNSFWAAAYSHLTRPGDLDKIAFSAAYLHRLKWAYHIARKATDLGSFESWMHVAKRREICGGQKEAVSMYRLATQAGHTRAMVRCLEFEEGRGNRRTAEGLAQEILERGSIIGFLRIAEVRDKLADHEGAEQAYLRIAHTGDKEVLYRLSGYRRRAADYDGAEALHSKNADAGDVFSMRRIADIRCQRGDHEGTHIMLQRAFEAGDDSALEESARLRERAGDYDGAELIYQRSIEVGRPLQLDRPVQRRERAGDREAAEQLALHYAEAGQTYP